MFLPTATTPLDRGLILMLAIMIVIVFIASNMEFHGRVPFWFVWFEMVQVVPFVLMFLDIEISFPRHLEPALDFRDSSLNAMLFDDDVWLEFLLDNVARSDLICCSKPSLMILYMGKSTFPWRRSRWQGARNRLSWFEEAVVLSLLVRHDIKLDVREDGKLLPHVKWICFSDGVYKTCLSSSIVDCDSKGSRRFSIKCFGSLLNEVDDKPSFGSSWPCGGYFGSSVVDRFVLSDFRYSHITIHPRPSLDSHISPI